MYLLSLLTYEYIHEAYYRGYWKSDELQNNNTKFVFYFTSLNKTDSYEVFYLVSSFYNYTGEFAFGERPFHFYGFINTTTYKSFAVACLPTLHHTRERLLDVLLSELELLSLEDMSGYEYLLELFAKQLKVEPSSIFFLDFSISNGTIESDKPFVSNITVKGSLNSSRLNITYSGNSFDQIVFLREGRIFCLLSSFFILANFYAWRSLHTLIGDRITADRVSVVSWSCHIIYDFFYSVVTFFIASKLTKLSLLYTFIYIVMSTNLLYMEFYKTFYLYCKAKDLENEDPVSKKKLCIIIIELLTMFFITLLLCLNILLFNSYRICLYILSSSFIPQIVLNIFTNKTDCTDIYYFLATLYRIFPLIYFFSYKNNIAEVDADYSVGINVPAYMVLQLIIIIIQNHFGGRFFLPRSMRGFNYRSASLQSKTECSVCKTDVECNEECMVTPCGHVFHSECLVPWMNQRRTCPYCRSDLPPLDGDDYERLL